MVIDVTLTGPGGEVKTTSVNGGGTLDIELNPGVWTIAARAVSDRPSVYSAAFPPRMLRAVGEADVTIKAGEITPVTVIMYTAVEVEDWVQLQEAAARARDDGKREYVFVTKNIHVPAGAGAVIVPANTDILLSSAPGKGTLNIARTGVTSGALFSIAGGSLTLGEDPARPAGGLGLDINGGGSSYGGNYPLIEMSGGGLIMYEGTTLRNNIRTASRGGGVYMSGGTFAMHGGTTAATPPAGCL